MTQQFIENRIEQQKRYMEEVRNSDRTPERKSELIRSAIEVLMYFTDKHIENVLEGSREFRKELDAVLKSIQ